MMIKARNFWALTVLLCWTAGIELRAGPPWGSTNGAYAVRPNLAAVDEFPVNQYNSLSNYTTRRITWQTMEATIGGLWSNRVSSLEGATGGLHSAVVTLQAQATSLNSQTGSLGARITVLESGGGGATNLTNLGRLTFGQDVYLERTAVNRLALRNNTNSYNVDIYRFSTNSNTDSEFGFMGWFSTEFQVGLNKTGVGQNRSLGLAISGSTRWRVGTDSSFAPTAPYALGTAALPVGHITSSGVLSASNLVVAGTGTTRVGINTTNPAVELDVYGGFRLNSLTGSSLFGLNASKDGTNFSLLSGLGLVGNGLTVTYPTNLSPSAAVNFNNKDLTDVATLRAAAVAAGSLTVTGGGPSTLLLGTGNLSGFSVEAPSVHVTNGLGVKFFASAPVQEIAPGSYNDWQMTNCAGVAMTLVFTNAGPGQWGSIQLPGAASGGSSSNFNITIVPPLGALTRFYFTTNGATTFTLSNAQSAQIEYWFTRLNGSNTMHAAMGRALQ